MAVEGTLKRRISPRLRRKRAFDHGPPISKIDTRPMAFVALFLAIVFLVPAAQTRTHTLIVELPMWSPFDVLPVEPQPYITIEILENGEIIVDGKPTPLADVVAAIRERNLNFPTVLFSPHANTGYGVAALVLNEIVKAGVSRSDICFDELERFRKFESVPYLPSSARVLPTDDDFHLALSLDYSPTGCELIQPAPLY